MSARVITDPSDIEASLGVRVRDLATVEACVAATLALENERALIMAQIARSEEDPSSVPRGWRTRAQAARSWKLRAIIAIRARRDQLEREMRPVVPQAISDKRRAILKTIRDELGEAEFDRLVSLTEKRNPHLDWTTQ